MKFNSFKIPQTAATVSVPDAIHRVVVVDCSGSMSSDLPKLRTHLKNKLPTMVLPDDTLTLIWFSGKGQCGTLFKQVKISTLLDLNNINAAIDRFIVPIGATGFKAPLEEVLNLVNASAGAEPFTLSFATDGYENVSTKESILKVCDALSDKLAAATFVEYSYYADHKMLMDMAEAVGGSVILADSFNSYTETLNSNLRTITSSKKHKISGIHAQYVIGSMADGFVIAKPDAVGLVTLPANVISYSYFTGTGEIEPVDVTVVEDGAYAVAALLQRGEGDQALELAGKIGDTELFDAVQNAFSKQDYANAVELATQFGSLKRPMFGNSERNTKLAVAPDAYNVLTMLMDIASVEGNLLHISHESFTYSSIGAKRETKDVDGFVPKFTDKAKDVKAPIATLKFDEDRPNVSILVRREGTASLPKNDLGFGESFDTFIWRNYTIVRDGIINTRFLPLILTKTTHDLLTAKGIIKEPFVIGKTYVIDTKGMPIINRNMAVKQKAADLFEDCFYLYKLKAAQKFVNSKIEKPEFSAKFAGLYGEEGAKFLKQYGITEGGFGPLTIKGEELDPYMAKILEVKIAGLSAIPSVADVEKAIAAKKNLTPSQQVMAEAIKLHENRTDMEVVKKNLVSEIRRLTESIVKKKFGVIIGKSWYTDIPFDAPTMEMDFGLSKKISCTVNLADKEV